MRGNTTVAYAVRLRNSINALKELKINHAKNSSSYLIGGANIPVLSKRFFGHQGLLVTGKQDGEPSLAV